MDMTVVTPIAVTSVDWNKLLGAVSQVICRPIGKSLDAANIMARGLAELISALGEFHTQGSNAIAVQRHAGFLLKHVSVSFFIHASPDCLHELLLAGRVSLLESEYPSMVIASANMEDWRTTVINLCSENQTRPMRLIGTRLLQAFADMDLDRIFEAYSRRTSNQGGLVLAAK